MNGGQAPQPAQSTGLFYRAQESDHWARESDWPFDDSQSVPIADLHADGDTAPEVLDYSYRPLLDRLGSECQHVLSIAESEAESLRAAAAEESRRIVTDAHRERAMVLSRATAKQALMYQEAEAEIGRWLQELEDERAAVLASAREEADRMVRAISDETRVRANAYLEAAKGDAERIVGAARIHTEIERQAVIADAPAAVLPVPPGPPSPPGPVSPSAGASSPEAANGERPRPDPYGDMFPEETRDEGSSDRGTEPATSNHVLQAVPATAAAQPVRHRRRHRFGRRKSGQS